MVDWTPKPSAPAAFNGVDALLSLIHGDPVWGWLEGWVHLYPSSYTDTGLFCLAGPWNVGTLNLGDLLNAANPISNDYVEGVARTEIKIIGALHDRLFAAMCQQAAPPDVGGWSDWVCTTFTTPGAFRADGLQQIPANATKFRARVTNLGGGGMPPGQLNGYNWPVTAASNYGTWSAASDVVLEDFIKSAPFNGGIAIEWANAGTHVTECYSFYGGGLGAPTTFEPAPQLQPDGYTPRVIPPTDAIGDVGPLLANIEFKLEYVLNLVQGLALASTPLPGGTTDVAEMTPDVEVPVGDAIGAIFTASEIPASVSLDFGSPQNVIRLCHINFGNAAGWYPSIWMTHTPFIVRPLPVATTKVTTTAVIPGATISVQLIKREAPGG